MSTRRQFTHLGAILLVFALCLLVAGTTFATQKKVITFWSWSPVKSTTDKMVAAFESTHPDIEVKATIYNYPDYLMALKSAAASGSLPDIVGLEPGAMVQEYQKFLIPLQSYAKKSWGADWQSKFYPIGIEQARLGNVASDPNFYMLPMELQTTNLWYNRPMFEKYGLEPPKTWEELRKVAAVLNKNRIAPMLQGGADGWQNIDVYMMIAQQTAPGVIYKAELGQASFADPGLVNAMKIWKSLFDEKIIQPGALGLHVYPNAATLFESGKGGMISLGSWHMQVAKFTPPIELAKGMEGFGAFLFPDVTGDGKPSNPLGGIDIGLGITTNATDKELAWEVVKDFIAGQGIQAAINDFNDLPAVKGVVPKTFTSEHEKDLWNLFTKEWLPKVTARQLRSPQVRQGLMDALAAVASGQKTPEKAMEDLQNTVKGK
ncbi:MAG: extracellular solute-binding protein [Firmicutes bacterium]|nr:extracellular solute-binding protein [Bacillota bacterium]